MIEYLENKLNMSLRIIGYVEWPPPTTEEDKAILHCLQNKINAIEEILSTAKESEDLAYYLYMDKRSVIEAN